MLPFSGRFTIFFYSKHPFKIRPASFLPNITYTAQGVFYLTLSQSKRVVGMWLFSCYFTIWKNNLCLCLAFQKILSWPYFVGMNCAKNGKMYLEFIVECTKSPLDILSRCCWYNIFQKSKSNCKMGDCVTSIYQNDKCSKVKWPYICSTTCY